MCGNIRPLEVKQAYYEQENAHTKESPEYAGRFTAHRRMISSTASNSPWLKRIGSFPTTCSPVVASLAAAILRDRA